MAKKPTARGKLIAESLNVATMIVAGTSTPIGRLQLIALVMKGYEAGVHGERRRRRRARAV